MMKESKDGLNAAHAHTEICTHSGEDLTSLGGYKTRKKGSSVFQNKCPEGPWDQLTLRTATGTEDDLVYETRRIIFLK